MKKILLVVISIILIQITGCATIFKGTSDNVNFNSEPQEAKVYVNGYSMGVTPVKLKLESNKNNSG